MFGKLREKISSFKKKEPLTFVIVAFVVILAVGFAGFEAMHLTGKAEFCKMCHPEDGTGPHAEYITWRTNIHSYADVSCLDCHGEPGLKGYYDAHIVAGLKSTYAFVFYSDEHITEILEKGHSDPEYAQGITPIESCLFCHTDEANAEMRRNRIISVGVEMRHIDEVKNPEYRKEFGLNDVIAEGVSIGVDPNHYGHLDRGLNCMDCHLGMGHGSQELYRAPEMETCFECHYEARQANPDTTAPENMDCAYCHSMQDSIQDGTYADDVEEIEWYMNDLTCDSCHYDPFTRPTPDTCAACHDASYKEIMTYTQSDFEARYEEVSEPMMTFLEERDEFPEEKLALFNEYRHLVRILEKDGSKGVHNPEYLSAVADRAAELIDEIENFEEHGEEGEHEAKIYIGEAAAKQHAEEVVEEEPAGPVNSEEMLAMVPGPINLAERYGITDGKQAQVVFEHENHVGNFACATCHNVDTFELNTPIENVEGMGNDFHKELCTPCHKENKAPTSCNTCHQK